MNILVIVGASILLLIGIIIIGVIMLQESKQANGLDALTGGSTDNYLGRNATKTKEAMLAKLTKVLAIAFFVIAFGLNLVVKFL